ncbi:AlpA family phage regulatory protein [Luteibacter sp. 621]|uniref:AlpA family phage regulatory protein n=1 Tax=Luteibacter sp. 621 TaxID=3373916 RepID=UPI003D2215E1
MAAADRPIRFLRLPEVMAVTGLSRSQVYKLIADRAFPRQVKLTLSTSAWVEAEVQEWCQARVAEREATAGPPALQRRSPPIPSRGRAGSQRLTRARTAAKHYCSFRAA